MFLQERQPMKYFIIYLVDIVIVYGKGLSINSLTYWLFLWVEI